MERISSCSDALDSLIGGGFPKGSLILVAGNPGTGKTVFSSRFLYYGAVNHGDNGLYVSFGETRSNFMRDMLKFGFDFEPLERKGKFKYLDLVTMREEGLTSILEMILEEIRRIEAKRLVIDSFSAIVQALEKPIDTRIILHTILSRIVRELGCTTILVSEVRTGSQKIGLGIEEFVVDGVFLFRTGDLDGRLIRDMEIIKMRGTPLPERKVIFTLAAGFKAFTPFKVKRVKRPRRFQPVDDPPGMFSTGVPDLDKVLGGGYPRGATVLFEVDENVSTLQYHLLLSPTPWNFLVKGRPTIVFPSSGVGHNVIVQRALEGGLTKEELSRLLRVAVSTFSAAPDEPYILRCKIGERLDLEEYFSRHLNMVEELKRETGQPVLHIVGIDTVRAVCGLENTLRLMNESAGLTRENGDLTIFILKPTLEHPRIFSAFADVHIKITREHGVLLFYGVKPRTNLYVLEMDTTMGYPTPKITPIM